MGYGDISPQERVVAFVSSLLYASGGRGVGIAAAVAVCVDVQGYTDELVLGAIRSAIFDDDGSLELNDRMRIIHRVPR